MSNIGKSKSSKTITMYCTCRGSHNVKQLMLCKRPTSAQKHEYWCGVLRMEIPSGGNSYFFMDEWLFLHSNLLVKYVVIKRVWTAFIHWHLSWYKTVRVYLDMVFIRWQKVLPNLNVFFFFLLCFVLFCFLFFWIVELHREKMPIVVTEILFKLPQILYKLAIT